jgi:hypothetical protein
MTEFVALATALAGSGRFRRCDRDYLGAKVEACGCCGTGHDRQHAVSARRPPCAVRLATLGATPGHRPQDVHAGKHQEGGRSPATLIEAKPELELAI